MAKAILLDFTVKNQRHLYIGYGKSIVISPWKGYDPRDDDWCCTRCNTQNHGKHLCFGCNRPHFLNAEQLEQLQKCKQSGLQVREKVAIGEYTEDNLHSHTKYLDFEYSKRSLDEITDQIILEKFNYNTNLIESNLQHLNIKQGEKILVSPWKGHDPRDDDWCCTLCNSHNYARHLCVRCNKPHVLNAEQLEQLQKCNASGSQMWEKVAMENI
uniref:RanBP2-type domain-containing protein n=1 Tax=Ditylenchus dipsaci TaxID=166011 RepID=A0A915D7E7_9BILA